MAKKSKSPQGKKDANDRDQSATLAVNRRARFDYEILDSAEAGIVLTGTEIKALRESSASIAEAYARIRDGEIWLFNMHIPPYGPARENHEPRRPRKLLMHRRQIAQWAELLETHPRTTVVPMRLYLTRGKAKVQVGVATGKRSYDKRQTIAKRDAERTMQRALRQAQR
ncbi:MAG: SsrA-binding protein SmpB [Dehalococcoidia bacterium]|nr:SsrA-binding protein SmpB [Dehalococcoidia bacterium]